MMHRCVSIAAKMRKCLTAELSGGARIHYIFQLLFVKSLEEVEPCEDLTDDDIRMAIQNATGPRNALFVPEVPVEVLMSRRSNVPIEYSLFYSSQLFIFYVNAAQR